MLRNYKNIFGIFFLTLVLSFGLVSTVYAHVVVTPSDSLPGAWELYTLKVPTEKSNPTIKIQLKIPSELNFEQYEPVSGWNVSFEKDASGKIQTIIWVANGEGILPGQFQEFKFVAQNPKNPAKVAWDAYQYYKDGSIVEWTKDAGTATPHSATNIVKGHVMTDGSVMADNMMSTEPTRTSGIDPNLYAAIWISSISLVIAILALFLTVRELRKKS